MRRVKFEFYSRRGHSAFFYFEIEMGECFRIRAFVVDRDSLGINFGIVSPADTNFAALLHAIFK